MFGNDIKALLVRREARAAVLAAGLALLLLAAGHAFGYLNLIYSGAGVMVDASQGSTSQVAAGRWALPLYWAVRGGVSAPMLVGLLCGAYLAAAAALVALALGMTRPLSLALLAGVLCLNPAVTAINAAALNVADAYFLALLLCLLGAVLSARGRGFVLPAAMCWGAGIALEQSMAAAGLALLLLLALRALLAGKSAREALVLLACGLISLALGMALYLLGWMLMARRIGADWEPVLCLPGSAQEGGLLGVYMEPLRRYLRPYTAYRMLGGVLGALLLAGSLALLSLAASRLARRERALSLALALLLPLVVNLPVIAGDAPAGTAQTFAYAILAVACVMVFDTAFAGVRTLRLAYGAGMGVLMLSAIIFSNQVYLKKNLEQQSTLSIMTRVIDRMERTEGYEPGSTPVALLGSLEASPLAAAREGFEHLEEFDAASDRFAADGVEENTWYMWEIMGYPCNLVSYYEAETIAESEEGRAMPAFPAQGSCRMIDGVLAVKLSE